MSAHLKMMMKTFTLKIQFQNMTSNFVIENLNMPTCVLEQGHQNRILVRISEYLKKIVCFVLVVSLITAFTELLSLC